MHEIGSMGRAAAVAVVVGFDCHLLHAEVVVDFVLKVQQKFRLRMTLAVVHHAR